MTKSKKMPAMQSSFLSSKSVNFNRLKREFQNRTPDYLLALVANFYYWLLLKDFAVVPSGSHWLILRKNLKLLSPTPKYLGMDLRTFEEKFEHYFGVERGDTVLDVGACIGDTTVPFALKAGKEGLVIAVEPEPINVFYLKANTSVFDNVRIVEKAAWNSKGTLKFSVHPKYPTGHSIVDDFGSYIEVQTDTLDNIVKPWNRRIDYAKIDVQGAELQVLRGAEKMLETTRKVVVETHYRHDERRTWPEISNFLNTRGFTIQITPEKIVYGSKKVFK